MAEALSCPEKEHWRAALQKEMDSIYSNNVWDLVELPEGRRLVGNKWVFKWKTGANGSIESYKACLVAQGFSQKRSQDYNKTFNPVIRLESLRSLTALTVQKGQVTAALLQNGHLEEEEFMGQPDGFVKKGKEYLVYRLKHKSNWLHCENVIYMYILYTHINSCSLPRIYMRVYRQYMHLHTGTGCQWLTVATCMHSLT